MIKEALAYFRDGEGFRRLFPLFRKKYESLGRIGGTVKVADFTEEELADLGRFFGRTTGELRKKGKISLEQFERQLQFTRFEGIGLKELLETYFGETLISKKEMKSRKDSEQKVFFDELEAGFPELRPWLDYVRDKSPDTYWIYRLMEASKPRFTAWMETLAKAVRDLPDQYERLPMFSQRITRDPHAFDQNNHLGRLFIHVLAVLSAEDVQSAPVLVPADSEGINDLLLKHRILRDDITNYVTCVNLLGETEAGVHPMWEAAATAHSVLNVPLRELMKLTKAYPAAGGSDVWIVENSGVYSSILDALPEVSFICTHGQFKLAALVLIDLLAENGCTIHYAGDLDPEGVSMAERLLLRHPEQVKLWKMDVASYRRSVTDIEISEERLNKLSSIKSAELTPVVDALKQTKKAGYQEALVPEMIRELEKRP
ncbi:TIGR02679 family protein [Virgibacillus kimchii]